GGVFTAKPSPSPARHRPGARSARRYGVLLILPQTEGDLNMRFGKKCLLRVEPLEDRCLLSADFVFDWNNLLLDVQRLRGQGNPQSARALAIMGAAVYDSVNAIKPTHTVYHVDARAFPAAESASADAAAAQAAHDVAFALYTVQADRDRFDA